GHHGAVLAAPWSNTSTRWTRPSGPQLRAGGPGGRLLGSYRSVRSAAETCVRAASCARGGSVSWEWASGEDVLGGALMAGWGTRVRRRWRDGGRPDAEPRRSARDQERDELAGGDRERLYQLLRDGHHLAGDVVRL